MSVTATYGRASFTLFRIGSLMLSIITGVLGLWVTMPELIRAKLAGDNYGSSQVAQAKWAAWIGLIRGDLWRDYGLASISGVLDPTTHKENFELGRIIAERAVRLSPHDAQAWLLLAWTSTASGRDIATLLKMSYYTGANEPSIIAPRLLLIARRGVSDDPELAELLEGEIQKILSERPDLRPAILAAYREASPATKVAIEQAVRENDPGFLNHLQPTVPSK